VLLDASCALLKHTAAIAEHDGASLAQELAVVRVVGELGGQVVGVLLRSARRPAAQPPSIFLTRSHNENCAALAGVGFAGGGVTDGCSPLSCSDARGGSRTARIRAAVPRCAGSVQGHLSGVLLHHPVVVVVL
jgi:hypothetical protein